MAILDIYLGRFIITSCTLVIFVLLSLFSFVDLVNELDDIGKGEYKILGAIQYVLLMVPRHMYELIPITALLGTTLGLGLLASYSEITALRAAGVSHWRFVKAIGVSGAVLIILSLFLGEIIAPLSEQAAVQNRSHALSSGKALASQAGIWTRDGKNYIKVEKVLSQDQLSGVHIYELLDNKVSSLIHAKFALYSEKNNWILQNGEKTIFGDNGVKLVPFTSMLWSSELIPEFFSSVSINPERLSFAEIYQFAHFLNDNGLEANHYWLNLWKKIYHPVLILLMMMIAIPFILGPMRSVGLGYRILVAAFIGISFYIFDQMMTHLGLVFNFNPFAIASIPPLVFFMVCMTLIIRSR